MNLIEYLFPKQCIFCSRIGYDICPRCFKGLINTLPTCCICKKINNDYWTHEQCFSPKIQCLTGWYLSNKIGRILEKKKRNGIYSTHQYLLECLIKKLGMEGKIEEYSVYPILSKNIYENRLNTHLSKYIAPRSTSKGNFLVIGESISHNTNLREIVKGLPSEEPLNIKLLCLFETIQLRAQSHSH